MIIALIAVLGAAPEMPAALAKKVGVPFLTEVEFTALGVEAVKAAEPGADAVATAPLRITVKLRGAEIILGLDNPWRASPENRPAAMWSHVKNLSASVANMTGLGGTAKEIVPLVRGRIDAAVMAIEQAASQQVAEKFAGDTWVLYAFNKPTEFVPVMPEDLKRLKLERSQLRELALKNMRVAIPPIEKMSKNGVTMIVLPSSGGNFEASLLLCDDVWAGMAKEVDGDLVAATPARDLLIVTGAKNADAIALLTSVAAKAYAEGDHPVSKQVLVRRKGTWGLLAK